MEYLDFEKPIGELETKIAALSNVDSSIDIEQEKQALQAKSVKLTKKIFSNLTDLQKSQLARHPNRAYTLDYISLIFDEFIELKGDRAFANDEAIIGGIAKIDGRSVMFIGQQKGRSTKEKIKYNFGMPRPEGYRKALRLMKMAEKFNLPIITFIDTPGAYPGIGAEERGQSEAIARNLWAMSNLQTPIISIIIGEGGSGGALAIGVADKVLMFENSIYSVISPEGCASILYKDAGKADIAAESLKLTAQHLLKFELIDEIIDEPTGGVHRDFDVAAENLRAAILDNLTTLRDLSLEELVSTRATKILEFGDFKE
jgi:acetyl-CoA carboxylase carboxyl transferase subunit alpha